MFNIQGSEMIFLLLVALIILGPEKLPDAIRKFGRAYSEFKKMANGFQGELRSALDEPMRELKDTADAMKAAANFDLGGILNPGTAEAAATDPAAPTGTAEAPQREQGLNFGSANPRKIAAGTFPAGNATPADAVPEEIKREPGLNFGSANPRPARVARDPLAPVEPPAVATDTAAEDEAS